MDTQQTIDRWLATTMREIPCRVVREQGDRIFVDTRLDGAALLALERYLKHFTGRYTEILCEEVRDANVLRRMADLRGKRPPTAKEK